MFKELAELWWINIGVIITYYRSSHQRCSVRKDALRNFTKFTRKHLCQSLFFNKVAILINSSPFLVAALIKKKKKKNTIEPFRGFFTLIFHCNISFWASDFVTAFTFPFFVSRHSLEHSICACYPWTLTCVCLYVVKNLLNKSVISRFSVAMFVSLFLVFLSFKADIHVKQHNLKQGNYKSVNQWSQHSWPFYVLLCPPHPLKLA